MKEKIEYLIELVKTAAACSGFFVFGICSILILIHRFSNPHLTETEIALYSLKEYWWGYLWFLIGYISLKSH